MCPTQLYDILKLAQPVTLNVKKLFSYSALSRRAEPYSDNVSYGKTGQWVRELKS